MYQDTNPFAPEALLDKRQDRRRTIRIKRSGLHKSKLLKLDRPGIKFAETIQELEQSFALVYAEYYKKGFIPKPNTLGLLYNIYSLLPGTTHIVAKSGSQVISNLTEIADSKEFGLPMDAIYKPELDELRAQGKSIVELSALATPAKHRWRNIFLYLVQVMYWYSVYAGVDEICVAVNPRHERFYKGLFPFEDLGPERHYPRVDAPAVGLRANVCAILEHMTKLCQELEFDTSLYNYFKSFDTKQPSEPWNHLSPEDTIQLWVLPNRLSSDAVQHFISLDPNIVQGLSQKQKDFLLQVYPKLSLA